MTATLRDTRLIEPPPRPLGNLRGLFVMLDNSARWWSADMYERGSRAVRVAGRTYVHVARPELARTVLLDEADAFVRSHIALAMLGPAMGEGLLTSDGAAWRHQRRLVAPVFHLATVEAFLSAFDRHALACGERLRRLDGRVAPVLPELVHATLDVVLETLFGDAGVDRDTIARDVADYLDQLGSPGLLDIMGAPTWVPRPSRARARRTVARLRARASTVLYRERARVGSPANAHHSLARRLLDARDPDTGEPMGDARIIDNALTFIGAGHETTSTALAWTLHLLASRPDWQDALVREAGAALGDAPADRAALDALGLHRRVLRESMRLFPPVAAIIRGVIRPVTLGEHRLVPGDHVTVAILPMHRNPAFWPNPDAFDPSRFDEGADHERFAYLPFGDGPRTCVGAGFAMAEATLLLARTLLACRFTPSGGPPPEPRLRVTLRPSDDMRLTVLDRIGP